MNFRERIFASCVNMQDKYRTGDFFPPDCYLERKKNFAFFGILMLSVLVIGIVSNPVRAQQENIPSSDSKNLEQSLSVVENAESSENSQSAIPNSPMEIAREMGSFLIPFIIASVIAVWFCIERLVVLRWGRVIPRPFVERFLQHLKQGKLDRETALQLCEENGSPVAEVFAHGIRKWGKPSVEVEQAIIDGGERQVSQLRKHLRVINGVATVTPLMGLLGTVIGMIQAFNNLAASSATGRAEQLAVGISLALLTTAAGLLIAIPSLITYMYLADRVDSIVMQIDLLAQNIVHFISAETLAMEASSSENRIRPPSHPHRSSKETV